MLDSMKKPIDLVKESLETPITRETDVLIVGGGPAGFGAAVAASRLNVDTLVVERFGWMGGMAAGNMVCNRFIMFNPQYIYRLGVKRIMGIPQELVERMREEGSAIPMTNAEWEPHREWDGSMNSIIDPERLKETMLDMVEESGGKLLFHAWGVNSWVENGAIKGVLFESKSGRFGIAAKVVVDATGDGDIGAFSGVPFETHYQDWTWPKPTKPGRQADEKYQPPKHRFNPTYGYLKTLITFRAIVTGIDLERYHAFLKDDIAYDKVKELCNKEGVALRGRKDRTPVYGLRAIGVSYSYRNCIDVDDLTFVSINGRKETRKNFNVMKKYLPGWENAVISSSLPQLGVRCSRQIKGEYTINEKDYFTLENRKFKDLVVRCTADIPYRSLVPVNVENLLIAGRAISTTYEMLDSFRTIVPCMAIGQAAGAAAALSVTNKVRPRDLDTDLLRTTLIHQGANI
jgi:hypothetical protein